MIHRIVHDRPLLDAIVATNCDISVTASQLCIQPYAIVKMGCGIYFLIRAYPLSGWIGFTYLFDSTVWYQYGMGYSNSFWMNTRGRLNYLSVSIYRCCFTSTTITYIHIIYVYIYDDLLRHKHSYDFLRRPQLSRVFFLLHRITSRGNPIVKIRLS